MKDQIIQGSIAQDILSLIANLAAVVRVQNGNLHDDTNALLAHADRVLAASPITAPASQLENAWYRAVADACCIAHIDWDKANPHKSVNDLINWHVQAALDPAVSEDAQKLIAQGMAQASQPSDIRRKALEEVTAKVKSHFDGWENLHIDTVFAYLDDLAQAPHKADGHFVHCGNSAKSPYPVAQQAGQPAPAVPDNCVVVPKVPTVAMCEAGAMDIMAPSIARYVYRAMINAAPAQGEKTK